MTDLLTVLAAILIIEGLTLALFPDHLKRVAVQVQSMPSEALRYVGLLAVLAGLFVGSFI